MEPIEPIKPVEITDLKIISGYKGAVLRGLKRSDPSFKDFGEAYFSEIHKDVVKGWKRHKSMTLNLITISGEIEFFIYDDREAPTLKSIKLSRNNYKRLTIPPMVWIAFKGIGDVNMLLNIADIEHDPEEVENVSLEEFQIKI